MSASQNDIRNLVLNSGLPLRQSSLRTIPEKQAAVWLGEDGTFNIAAPADSAVLNDFEGETSAFGDGLVRLAGPAGSHNAAALRGVLPNLQPRLLGLGTSIGFGDRLGLATEGHVCSLQQTLEAHPGAQMSPIFAQQSIREMERTSREPREVLDDATWGAFAAGWTGPVGADADHLKTTADIDRCAREGFTFYTIDPGEHVWDDAATASAAELEARLGKLPWDGLETDLKELSSRYAALRLEAGERELTFPEEETARAAAKYGAAVVHITSMYRHLKSLNIPFELEVSVDETESPTTLLEHAFMALELKRLGVEWVSLAPRIVGAFEKGIDYRGDRAELITYLKEHAALARALGPYKLSLHSGSDKFSVFGPMAEATAGLVHLKTAGTSYLEALRIMAAERPARFRDVLTLARERFETDRRTYQISSELTDVPEAAALTDRQLAELLDQDGGRQILHVTFGSVLDAFGTELKELLRERHEAHTAGVAAHFRRHLEPFAPHADVTG